MKKSYLSNYLKLYFWQFFAIVLNFAAMLVVLPIISKNSELFGIYSLCVSITIFLSYADIGFVSAGIKYASEYFSRDELENEVGVTGFVLFVLLIGISPYIACMLWFWYNPSVIISDLSPAMIPTASSMFLALAIFAPNLLFQKASQFIYGVRVEDFITRQINIIGHVVKILSIFYFFRSGQKDIVGYFIFFQCVNFLCFFAAFILAGYRYKFPLTKLIKSIRYSALYFSSTRNLAFASFYATIASVLYYELDSLVIGKYFGINSIAVYAVGLSMLTFLRSIFGVIFSPLTARFNHFVGLGDYEELKLFYSKIILVLFPVLFFPVISIILLMNNLVLCWVGDDYQMSIPISQFLVGTFLFAFLSYPASILLMAYEKTKLILGISTLLMVVFWSGIFLMGTQLGILAFSLFKFISYSLSVVIFAVFSIKFLNGSIWKLNKKYLFPTISSVVVLTISIQYLQKLLPIEKSIANLILVIAIGGIASLMAIALYFTLNRDFRNEVLFIVSRVRQNFGFGCFNKNI
jgi:O-antigen/teichoic acid export membrane protein